MKKLTILCGISGSGKSYWAHQQWSKLPLETLIVNRDKIRELLFGYGEANISKYYERGDHYKLEKEVTKYEDTLIHDGLNDDKHVIVDSTNLKKSYIQRFSYWNVPTELVVAKIGLDEAKANNAKRVRKVSEEVIEKQYNQIQSLYNVEDYKFDFSTTTVLYPEGLSQPNCYVFDIDGTIAKLGKRSPYDYTKVSVDTPIKSIMEVMKQLTNTNHKSDTKIFVCSGRKDLCRSDTEKWLKKYGIKHDGLYMRAAKDDRKDYIVKEEMLEKIHNVNPIVCIFDDRLQVVRRMRSLGYKVCNVEYNNF